MMAAMAAQTTRVRVAILVTGVTYRHPAVAANIAATIDHISGGRAEFGVGAAWLEDEHRQYAPYDWQSLELVMREVAPALRSEHD
jgi:alkanesulfonate monooxygenase SsuD/methylene tetrahydromethanopterin reductase-like flavin-dependent oxidoreductase (luciferase family)